MLPGFGQPSADGVAVKIAIQGELGSNSHMAALKVVADQGGVAFSQVAELLPCGLSADVFERLADGTAALAVLPIENSLYGSVFEHYDLLLDSGVSVVGETMLRIRHHVIAAPGVKLNDLRRVMSHPVALAQCRKWLHEHPAIEAVPFYDTAGSVKEVMKTGRRDCAGIAPELAAGEYGGQVIVGGVEDHKENYTRFYVLTAAKVTNWAADADKASVAFSLEHRPGSLIEALEVFRHAGLNLTKIECQGGLGSISSSRMFGLKMDCGWTRRLVNCAGPARW
jgi:prephenate dehydratase